MTALRKLREAGCRRPDVRTARNRQTSVIEPAFHDLVTVQGDGDTTVADLVGEYTQTGDGRYVLIHGPWSARCAKVGPCSLTMPP